MQSGIHQRASRAFHLLMVAAVVAVSVFNSQFWSPVFDPVLFHLARLLPKAATTHAGFLYLNAGFVALMTAAIAGLPAALYERLVGRGRSSVISLGVWLAGAILISWPAIRTWLEDF
ncbi:MAG TPA: hypothetical protein VFV47_04435 [Hyphomicrobiaceae bacterium]|nr:hypothetical protein [Hyphomicrobiaceae bacterium]